MQTKSDAYLEMIRQHVLRPIAATDLSESCTATLILLFAGIDGLGKLLHPSDNAGVRERFDYYIDMYMNARYASHKTDLYKLRNSLAHNALNFTAFISKTKMGEMHHLQASSLPGFIFVSSSVLTRDFDSSIRRVENALRSDTTLLAVAEARLQWLDDDTYAYWGQFSTPPGPVPFIHMH
jgi:hypothetical protein